ncbi:MAG: hypothetical protein NTW69_01355 [Chloroflexi bacterium]|nr:hypothetical protein [Chloroflexota bacterium]
MKYTNRYSTLLNLVLLITLVACQSLAPSTLTKTPSYTKIPLPTETLTPTLIPPTSVPLPTRVPMDDFMKGISYVQWDRGGFTSKGSDALLQRSIPQMGATWIALIVTCNQKTIDSTDIFCANGPTDDETIYAIQTAHAAGLRVMLKPHLDLSDDPSHWRGEIGLNFNKDQWQLWFKSYADYITHFASLAQDQGVEAFVVGTEMVTPSTHDQEWRDIVKAVRAQYSGPLTYAGFGNEFSMTWWDALDMIGVDAYYSIANSASPTPDQLVAGWKPLVAKLEALSKRFDKPIIFTEVGYQSLDGVAMSGIGASLSNQLDMQEQADCYEAVFRVFSDKPWWRGVFWWGLDTNAAQGGIYDNEFPPLGKPAEDVLRQYFGAPVHSQPAPSMSNDALVIEDSVLVYDDKLLPGWGDWSWGVFRKLEFTEQPYKGVHSMSLIFFDNQWDTLSLHHIQPIDLSGYDWLEFYIWSENDAHTTLRVELLTTGGISYYWKPLIFDPAYIEGGQRQAGKWQRVLIPISVLAPENSLIGGLNIYLDGQAGTKVQIDQIRFLKTK